MRQMGFFKFAAKRVSSVSCILVTCGVLVLPTSVFGQVDEARQAIESGNNVRAVDILSATLADQPSSDAYLYLGIAYRNMKEYQKAEDVFNEGSKRYPDDARFHVELAHLFIDNNDIDAAKSELRRTLVIDPTNNFASDQLATIDMSEGDVQSALRSWNKSGRPYINDILHNYYLNFGSWVVRRAVTFHPAGVLRYSQWKTTEARLLETGNYSNVGLEIEPTRVPDQYNAVVRTTARTNSLANFMFDAVKGALIQTTYLNVWNIGNSGVTFNGTYRYDSQRRLVDGELQIPLPVAGLTHLEIGNIWRNENWNLSPVIQPQFLGQAPFLYKDNAVRVAVKHIPNYRVELGAGFEYRNRAASGSIATLDENSLNTGLFTAETSLLFFDGTYKNRLSVDAFGARRAIVGNTQFTGGSAELNNRVVLSKDTRTNFDWTIKGGTIRGSNIPVDNYFMLGIGIPTTNILRGHTVANDGQYGNGPMGTDFVLFNTDVDRKLATIPFFNTVNIPYFQVKWLVFFDGAKTWDRQHIFQEGKLLLDTGFGLRFETPTHSINFVYGRSLRDGNSIISGYFQRRFW
jgi:tetratricopeptide (TPR) repeat protein